MVLFETTFKGSPVIFHDDHFIYKGAHVHYDEITNISYRKSDPPVVMFDYRGRHLGIPYQKSDEQSILDIFENIKQKNDLTVTQKFKTIPEELEEKNAETLQSKPEAPAQKKKGKTAIIVISIIIVLVAAAGLSFMALNNGKDNSKSVPPATQETEAEILDLTGEWTQTNKNSESNYMEASITGDSITINWVLEDSDSVSLYWAGSYVAPTENTSKYSWESKNDTTKTDSALLASTSETKKFTYKNGVLSFEASAMGETMTVEMEKK